MITAFVLIAGIAIGVMLFAFILWYIENKELAAALRERDAATAKLSAIHDAVKNGKSGTARKIARMAK